MQDNDKTKEHLIQELALLRKRIAELEVSEAEYGKAQAALEEAGKQFQNVFELAGDSILIIDPTTRRIVNANANAARRLGYDREELLKLSLSDFELPADEDSDSSMVWESNFSRTMYYECYHRRKDGTVMPVGVSSRLVTHDERPVLLNFVRDITRRKQVEAEREQLIVELDAYAHTVAHDLKNPLQLLIGHSSLLLDEFLELPEEEIRDRLGVVYQTGLKMHNIIDELLLLASVRKKEEIGLVALDMPSIVGEALSRLSDVMLEADAELRVPDAWPEALGYPAWVEEVWVNYISNALKYGGEPPLVELGATPEEGGMVRFWVRDNGPGIAPEAQAQLFSQFARLDETRAQGHGLGLSIVLRIVERLGGTVGVESRVGEGSIFSFSLPVPD